MDSRAEYAKVKSNLPSFGAYYINTYDEIVGITYYGIPQEWSDEVFSAYATYDNGVNTKNWFVHRLSNGFARISKEKMLRLGATHFRMTGDRKWAKR